MIFIILSSIFLTTSILSWTNKYEKITKNSFIALLVVIVIGLTVDFAFSNNESDCVVSKYWILHFEGMDDNRAIIENGKIGLTFNDENGHLINKYFYPVHLFQNRHITFDGKDKVELITRKRVNENSWLFLGIVPKYDIFLKLCENFVVQNGDYIMTKDAVKK